MSITEARSQLGHKCVDKSLITGVDLCCGAGGLTHGLIRGGIHIAAGIDIDPSCRFPYEQNNAAHFLERSVTDLTADELTELYGEAKVRLLAGCAPCQPYSTYSRKGHRLKKDGSWILVEEFARLVRETKPELVTMENVPQLKDQEVFETFLAALTEYFVWWDVVECARFGVPQTRERLVLLASRFGKVRLVDDAGADGAVPTVRRTIEHLPKLAAGCSDPDDPIHRASRLSQLNLRRIQASKPAGTWRDWDEALLSACHRKETGKTYPSVYGRMAWDDPAPTITTQCFGYGNGRFGHPEQNRAISLREAALLQTFPPDYAFTPKDEPVRFSHLGRLIGNAVPVKVGEAVGRSLVAHVRESQGHNPIGSTSRC